MTVPPESSRLRANRSFGLLFVIFFAVLGAVSFWRGGASYVYYFGLSLATLVVAWLRPALLDPFERAWMRLGALLHRIVSPVVMGILFFAVITPYALAMRIARRDALRRRFDPAARSYWIPRVPPGPEPSSFRNQY